MILKVKPMPGATTARAIVAGEIVIFGSSCCRSSNCRGIVVRQLLCYWGNSRYGHRMSNNCRWKNCRLSYCYLGSNCRQSNCQPIRSICRLRKVIAGAFIVGAIITGVIFAGTIVGGALIARGIVVGENFAGIIVAGVNFTGA